MTRTRVLTALTLLLVGAAVTAASARSLEIRWLSTRMYAHGGHPLRDAETGSFVPGPIVAYFVYDAYAPNTCVLVLRDMGSNTTTMTAADPTSCRVRYGP